MHIYKDIKTLNQYIDKYNLNKIIDKGLTDNYEFHVFEKGELVCKADEPVLYFYFLLKGKTKLYTMSDDGKILLYRFYESFTNFGDIEILNNTNYRINVEAITKSLLLAFPVSYIKSVCLDSKNFLKFLCSDLSVKLDTVSVKNSSNILYPLKNRLAYFITEHITSSGQTIVNLTSSYKEIAESLGTTYRHLNRTLCEFKNENLIDINEKQIIILNEKALRKLSKGL